MVQTFKKAAHSFKFWWGGRLGRRRSAAAKNSLWIGLRSIDGARRAGILPQKTELPVKIITPCCAVPLGAFALVLLVLITGGCAQNSAAKHRPKTIEVALAGESFHLELALTMAQRYQGLSDRKYIAPRGGMLFVFKHPGELGFVMRRCYVPIDLIYLGADGRVLNTFHMKVQPYNTPEAKLKVYASKGPAQFAIELAGGTLEKLRLKPGEKIELPLSELIDWAQ